jgi:cyclic beta-1,2-glucan synthetase
MPEDAAVDAALRAGIGALNARHGHAGVGAFHLLHRPRRFNPSEGCWMGWERKRGKLEELNHLLAGEASDAFTVREGGEGRLAGIRFVITLDADTQLPLATAGRLIGTFAHPLNRARFDPSTGRVRRGYTVIQPRVEIAPEAGNRSWFARLYSGDTAIDIYTRAVSDVYQDVFGSGIFVGKGIYEVATFRQSLAGRVPENALASHDLFEGVHGRAALASDIVLYEGFPTHYASFTRRWHRWVRGDWQLLPWLRRQVPGPGGTQLPNRLSLLDRWKILDNLRRSLLPPSLVVLLAAGWLGLPGSPWAWTALGVAAPAAYLFMDLVTGLARGRRRGAVRGTFRAAADQAGHWMLAVVFLAQDAVVALDAIVRTLWRMHVSHRHLLQWTAAAEVDTHLGRRSSRALVWRRLVTAPMVASALGVAIAIVRPGALASAAPILLLWALAPEIALLIGRARKATAEAISEEQRLYLRRLARRTWLYFETLVGPEDHWLPPDNLQEHPRRTIAHRTSPTNVGMALLSTLAATDFGHLGLPELVVRLRYSFDTLARLPRHRGHFFNWYGTQSLHPLEPRYVSTVDSGNLAVSLVALEEGCRELPRMHPRAVMGRMRAALLLSIAGSRHRRRRRGLQRVRGIVSASRLCVAIRSGSILAHLCRGLQPSTARSHGHSTRSGLRRGCAAPHLARARAPGCTRCSATSSSRAWLPFGRRPRARESTSRALPPPTWPSRMSPSAAPGRPTRGLPGRRPG